MKIPFSDMPRAGTETYRHAAVSVRPPRWPTPLWKTRPKSGKSLNKLWIICGYPVDGFWIDFGV